MIKKREIGLEELKGIQLGILNDVAMFCEKNDINYFLTYGTLIGAVRHKGYIPWDDDIDIAMPRPDYIKFLETYNNKKSYYRMTCFELNDRYSLPFGKVTDTRTIMIESMYKANHNYGVYIDVFPIDGVKDEKSVKKAQRLRRELNAKQAVLGRGRGFWGDIKIIIGKLLLLHKSVSSILSKISRICMTYKYEECDKVAYIPSLYTSSKIIIDKKLISANDFGEFEGKKYRIPIGYDAFLRQIYGDYMIFPPKDRQVSHHAFKAYWI